MREFADELLAASSELTDASGVLVGADGHYDDGLRSLEAANKSGRDSFRHATALGELLRQAIAVQGLSQERLGEAQRHTADAATAARYGLNAVDRAQAEVGAPVGRILKATDGTANPRTSKLSEEAAALPAKVEVPEAVAAVLATDAATEAVSPENNRFAKVMELLRAAHNEVSIMISDIQGCGEVINQTREVVTEARAGAENARTSTSEVSDTAEGIANSYL